MKYDLESRKDDLGTQGNSNQLYVFVLGDDEVEKTTFLHNLFSPDKRKKASKSVGGDIHIKHVEMEKGANLKVEFIEIASDFKKSSCLEIFVDYIFEKTNDIPLSRIAVLFLFDCRNLKSLYSVNDWLPWLAQCISKNEKGPRKTRLESEDSPLLSESQKMSQSSGQSPLMIKEHGGIKEIPVVLVASKSDPASLASIRSHPPAFLKHVFPDKMPVKLVLENQETQIRDFIEAVNLKSLAKEHDEKLLEITLGSGNFDKKSHKTKAERIQDNIVYFLKRIFFIQ